ncbi:hypothetical protein FB451DRAFT_265686 [Mycena latifolia]|nr:hypothetical protein FB451DRAFT_265686 [Mycena latifolia]
MIMASTTSTTSPPIPSASSTTSPPLPSAPVTLTGPQAPNPPPKTQSPSTTSSPLTLISRVETAPVNPNPPHSTYSFRLWVQPKGTTHADMRLDVTDNLLYQPLLAASCKILDQLVVSPYALCIMRTTVSLVFEENTTFQDLFFATHGQNCFPSSELISSYLRRTPPDIVIAHLGEKNGCLAWGLVKKGTTTTAQKNEIFISQELAAAVLAVNDPVGNHSAETTAHLRQIHRLLWVVTYCHELQHALLKASFSPAFITPTNSTPGSADGRGHGEAGTNFENKFFGFVLLVEIKTLNTTGSDKLWRIESALAQKGGSIYILDPRTIKKMINDMDDGKRYAFDDTKASISPPQQIDVVRWRASQDQAAGPSPEAGDSIPFQSVRGLGIEYVDDEGVWNRF